MSLVRFDPSIVTVKQSIIVSQQEGEGAPKHIQLQMVLGKKRSNLPTQNGFFYDDSSEVD